MPEDEADMFCDNQLYKHIHIKGNAVWLHVTLNELFRRFWFFTPTSLQHQYF